MKRITISPSPELYQALVALKKASGTPMSKWVVLFLEQNIPLLYELSKTINLAASDPVSALDHLVETSNELTSDSNQLTLEIDRLANELNKKPGM